VRPLLTCPPFSNWRATYCGKVSRRLVSEELDAGRRAIVVCWTVGRLGAVRDLRFSLVSYRSVRTIRNRGLSVKRGRWAAQVEPKSPTVSLSSA